MFDTHCHIHDDDYPLDASTVLSAAHSDGISQLICVGTDVNSSQNAINFSRIHNEVYASVGIHPHFAKDDHDLSALAHLAEAEQVVAIGECGLDYYYEFSSREKQRELFVKQIRIAEVNNLPMIFHVRGSREKPHDAFDDFFSIIDGKNIRGVVHSFSADSDILEHILTQGLYVGVNGIVTFMKDALQIEAIKRVPIEKLLTETDAPLLTPEPFRGTINEPKHIRQIIDHLSTIRDESVEQLAAITTKNANKLFLSR